MKFEYDNQRVERQFEDTTFMRKSLGDLARPTKKRLDQLKAARVYGDFTALGLGKPHPLEGNLQGCIGIHINANCRLIIRPHVDSMDINELAKCETVTIKGVVDYHGDKQNWIIP